MWKRVSKINFDLNMKYEALAPLFHDLIYLVLVFFVLFLLINSKMAPYGAALALTLCLSRMLYDFHKKPTAKNTTILPEADGRIETGPLQFGNDWPGVFLRGDTAISYVMALNEVLKMLPPESLGAYQMRGLATLLNSANVNPPLRKKLDNAIAGKESIFNMCQDCPHATEEEFRRAHALELGG